MYNTHIYTTHKHVYTHKYTTYQLPMTAVPWAVTQRKGSGSIKTAVNFLALEEERKNSPADYENEDGYYIHDYPMKRAVRNCAKKKWVKLWGVPVLEGTNPPTVLLWVQHVLKQSISSTWRNLTEVMEAITTLRRDGELVKDVHKENSCDFLNVTKQSIWVVDNF